MKMPDGISESTPDESGSIHRPTSGSAISIDHLLTAFTGDNVKYLASKAVDENGEPKVFYRIGNFNPENASGHAYWASNPKTANSYMKPYPEIGQYMTPAFIRANETIDANGTNTKQREGHGAIWRAEDRGSITKQAVLVRNVSDPDFSASNRERVP